MLHVHVVNVIGAQLYGALRMPHPSYTADCPQVISCRAAVAWEAKQPLSLETIEVEPPREGEVRVQVSTPTVHVISPGVALVPNSRCLPFPTALFPSDHCYGSVPH